MGTTHTSASGAHRIVVVRHDHRGESIYIGRAFRGEPASVLANPRSLRGGWSRGATIAHYERELREALDRGSPVASWNGHPLEEDGRVAIRAEMNRLFSALRAQGTIALRCFCAPLACHGDVISRVLIEKLDEVARRAA